MTGTRLAFSAWAKAKVTVTTKQLSLIDRGPEYGMPPTGGWNGIDRLHASTDNYYPGRIVSYQ